MAKATQKNTEIKDAELVAEAAPTENTPEVKIEVEQPAAKAGKRSSKAQKEADEKRSKEERKASASETRDAKKVATKPPRSRLERAGKKMREAAKLVDKTKTYGLKEALELAVSTSTTKFDATVEVHVNLDVDPKQADQNVRGSIVLPAGTGKSLRVAAFVEGPDEDKAKKAGADLVGADSLQANLEKEQIDFDLIVTTPALMPRLSKFARFLGPRGLMPSPKSGTVTNNVDKAVQEAKAGRVEYRVDSAGIIHMGIGKISFGAEKLLENAEAALSSIKAARPASVKGAFVKSVYISSTMGPSIRTQQP